MKKQVTILGGKILGLYAAIKCIDLGYEVSIIDKSGVLGNLNYTNYQFFNKNHKFYISLLNKFDIQYTSHTKERIDKIFDIFSYIIQKSKLMPNRNLYTQSFEIFCKMLLLPYEYEILKNYLFEYECIFSNMSAMDFISIYINDIVMYKEYYELHDNINILINKMIKYLTDKGAKFILNTEIKNIQYFNNNKANLISTTKNYICDILIITISNENLHHYKIFNKDHLRLLDSVSLFNVKDNNLYNIVYKTATINNDINIQTNLLDHLHIVYPIQKYNNIHLWKIGTNNIIIREKIRNISPFIFICSESFSKNPFFINYSFESFENILPNITRLSYS